MSRAEDLHRLQALDLEGDAKRRRLAEVEIALKDSAALERAQRRHARATSVAQRRTALQTDLDLALQSLVDKIAREEERLYSGTVRNPKQLEELQEEVASLRRRQQKVEDDLLAAMIASEEADEASADARAQLAAAGASREAKQEELGSERIALALRLAEIGEERATALRSIGGGDLSTYESLRKRKGGLAVAVVRGDTCTACGVAVSANRRWHMREGNLECCSNCERVLVLA